MAFFDRFWVVAFAPPTDLGPEPGRDELAGAAPRAGLGAAGSKKCATNPAAPAGVRPSVSSATMRACCQDMAPAASASITGGREQIRRDWSTRALAAAELMVRIPAISSTADISA